MSQNNTPERLFHQEYLKNVLSPLLGNRFRIRNNDKATTNGLVVETSIECAFNVSIDHYGLRFYIKGDNHYLKKSLQEAFRNGMKHAGISPMTLDNLGRPEIKNDTPFTNIIDGMLEVLEVQLGRIYEGSIKSLQVSENGFVVNGIEFFISKY